VSYQGKSIDQAAAKPREDYGPVSAEESPDEVHDRIRERMDRKLSVARANLGEAYEWAKINSDIGADARNCLLGAIDALDQFGQTLSADRGASIVSARS